MLATIRPDGSAVGAFFCQNHFSVAQLAPFGLIFATRYVTINPFSCLMKATLPTIKNYSDEELVRLYVETQRNAYFEELYERYSDKVFRKCLSFVKDRAKAEDFTHDIFIKLIVKIGSFKETSRFSTWLFSITYNFCMDQLRSNKKAPETELDEDMDLANEYEADELEEVEMEAVRLRQALDKIAPDERTIVLMKYQDDFSIKEIADVFNITESAVKMRLKRTREKLKKYYFESVIIWILFIVKIMLVLKSYL